MMNIEDKRTHIEVRHDENQQVKKDFLVEVEDNHKDDQESSLSECHECNECDEHPELIQEFLEESYGPM